jgi:hypothetical protein
MDLEVVQTHVTSLIDVLEMYGYAWKMPWSSSHALLVRHFFHVVTSAGTRRVHVHVHDHGQFCRQRHSCTSFDLGQAFITLQWQR